jgi:hypothetical protein
LCAAPFALWFVASVLHKFPYGASCRLSQHVAPAICLTAGLGAAACVERVRSARLRRWCVVVDCGFFVLIGVGGTVRDVVKPYRDVDVQWMRQEMAKLQAETPPEADVVVLNDPDDLDAVFRWHVGLWGDRVAWHGAIDWDRSDIGEVVGIRFWSHEPGAAVRTAPPALPADLAAQLQKRDAHWVLQVAVSDTGQPADRRDPIKHVDQFHWVRTRPAAIDTGSD